VIAGANYVTFLQAHEKGTLGLRTLAEGVRLAPHMMDVLVPGDSSIREPADLAGSTVVVNILNNIQSLSSVPVAEAAVRAVIEFLRPLPSVALIPLVSLLPGSGLGTEVALVAYA
jgi:hypothetical protein